MDTTLRYLGLITFIYTSYRLANHLYTYLRQSTLPRYLHRTAPTYALITGSSDGIGLALAYELCSHGFNVIIHGRNPEKLVRAKEALQATHPSRDIRTLVCDAVTFTPLSLEALLLETDIIALHISILINNVGGTAGLVKQPFQRFALASPEEVDSLIAVNQRFTTHLTRILLPKFTASKLPVLIMNTSSQSHIGMPYVVTYSSTKGYITAFSHALGVELSTDGHDVEVLNMLVGSVRSNQNKGKVSFFEPSSQTMAKAALARVGCGKGSISGYWPHALQIWGVELLPGWVGDRIIGGMLKPLADTGSKEW